MTIISRFPILLITLFACMILGSCARVSRERTLPPSIDTVYVPMVINRTAEIGIEEDITVYIQEEFLADGRVDLEVRRASDAHIIVTLTEFEEEARSFDTDNYPRLIRQTIEAKVQILQNKPNKPPFGPTRDVSATGSFNNDARTINFTPKDQGRDLVLRNIARKIVQEVITGRFEDL